MNAPIKQHLIDPEICIRCHTCEDACPIGAISHNDDNVVVDASMCEHCLHCIGPCPTGAIDNWRVVSSPYSLDEQLEWMDLPEQAEIAISDGTSGASLDDAIQQLLDTAHEGAGGQARAPATASQPSINLHNISNPLRVRVQGNFRLTADDADSDVRHLVIDLADHTFPVLEGQSIGIIAPGLDDNGKPHLPRLYSISSPRDGERPQTNNLSLTIKREKHGICSNYLCDLQRDDEVEIIGPFGSTFLMPDDPDANLIMICTGTGSAPFRAFTMQRQRTSPEIQNKLMLFFGARSSSSLPYFGPLKKVPEQFMKTIFCLSREKDLPKKYVQQGMLDEKESLASLLPLPKTHIYMCGLKSMEEGVEQAFEQIANSSGLDWSKLRTTMRDEGRYHVETY